MLTLKEAVEQTGKSRPGILKAIRSGRLSATKKEGQWIIDPAELFRVYEKVTDTEQQKLSQVTDTEIIRLQAENEAFKKQLEREQEFNRELSRRLDQESEERRKLTMMLTDMRPKAPQKPVDGLRVRLARWIAGNS